jgi:hypothetical protein
MDEEFAGQGKKVNNFSVNLLFARDRPLRAFPFFTGIR